MTQEYLNKMRLDRQSPQQPLGFTKEMEENWALI